MGRNLDKLRDVNSVILRKISFNNDGNKDKGKDNIKQRLDDCYDEWYDVLKEDFEKIKKIEQKLLYFIDMKVHKGGFQTENSEGQIDMMMSDWYDGFNTTNEPWDHIDNFPNIPKEISEKDAKSHPMYKMSRDLLKKVDARHFGVQRLFKKLGYSVG